MIRQYVEIEILGTMVLDAHFECPEDEADDFDLEAAIKVWCEAKGYNFSNVEWYPLYEETVETPHEGLQTYII